MAEHTSPLDLQDGMMDMEQAAMLIEPRAVTQLLDMLDDDRSSPEELTTAREAAGFRRGTDGRVALHADGGHWFSIKPDSQAAGYMLLRDEADGFCFYLPADPTGRLQQIDLSSDAVVAQLYGNAAWQDVLQPLQTEDSSRGEVVPLRMDARAFRSTEAMLDGAEDSPLAEGWAKVAARGW